MRPASQIVQVAQKYDCELLIRKGDRTVDGSIMLDVLTLAAERGAVLNLETRGEQAQAALDELINLFERNVKAEGAS